MQSKVEPLQNIGPELYNLEPNPLDIKPVLESLECLHSKLKELTYEDGLQ